MCRYSNFRTAFFTHLQESDYFFSKRRTSSRILNLLKTLKARIPTNGQVLKLCRLNKVLLLFSARFCVFGCPHTLSLLRRITFLGSIVSNLALTSVCQTNNKTRRRVLKIQFMPNRLSIYQKLELFQNDILQIRKLWCDTGRRQTLSTNHPRFSHFNARFIYRGSEILIEM